MIEGHGNDRYRYGDRIKIDFSSNIAYNNHSELIIKQLREQLSAIENYPDPTAQVLCQKIAKRYEIEPQSVMVCNGSAESFYLVAHYIARVRSTNDRSAKSLVFTPSFAEYEDSCKVYDHQIEFADLRQFNEIEYSQFDSVWIGTPNNPDGFRVSIEEIERTAKLHPNCFFVVDRAYNDLSASCDKDTTNHEIPNNIILIHSLTKTFGIPGIRLGYIIANKGNIDELKALRPPWSVNALSLVAGEFVMDNYDRLSVDIEELLGESKRLQDELSKLEFLEVEPSDTNFFLCRIVIESRAEELHHYLVHNHGILIRNASNFRGLTPHHFRIAAQESSSNNTLIEALKQWR